MNQTTKLPNEHKMGHILISAELGHNMELHWMIIKRMNERREEKEMDKLIKKMDNVMNLPKI